ncbi:MAG: transketolase, partial [Patescibacteria group bacterium]|nr:transketolase [Patescibacteria group bacterium]
MDVSLLEGYELDGGKLAGHVTRGSVPGIEALSGYLGHGLPIGVGMAVAGKKQQAPWRVVVVMSDGECDEGTTWESALFAAHHQLDHLLVIIDYNGLQGYGYVDDVLSLSPLSTKWRSFGWDVGVCYGHLFSSLHHAYSSLLQTTGKPGII